MAHVRKTIRDLLKTALDTVSFCGNNCFQTRVYNLDSGIMPAIILYTVDEDSEPTESREELTRDLKIIVETYYKSTSASLDDLMDAAALQIEAAIDGISTAVWDTIFLSSTGISYDSERDKPVGVMTMTYNIQYRT